MSRIAVAIVALTLLTSCSVRHHCGPGERWDRGRAVLIPFWTGKVNMMVPTYPNGRCEARRG